jgi:hypothetical protein
VNTAVVKPRSRALYHEDNRGQCGIPDVRSTAGYLPRLRLLQRKIHPVSTNKHQMPSPKPGNISLTPCQMPS